LKKYLHWFEGAELHIHTDHKPLTFNGGGKQQSARQVREHAFISQLNVTWHHIPGHLNGAADFLSRVEDSDG